jgi:uncharacterized protein YjbI with pentapeptide repeats
MPRLSYEDSCRRLEGTYIEPGISSMPDRMPHPDDEERWGVSFFRTFVGDGDDLSNLTLPRTFFGRSEINNALFRETDFSESFMCWNDFTDVDFTQAILARCDMRAAEFTRVKFVSADLSGADLRQSQFTQCDFSGAHMAGAVLTRKQGDKLRLSDAQRGDIAWTEVDGAEPDGG